MELATARGTAGAAGWPGQRVHGSRRGEPEGPGEFVSERAHGVPGRRQETAREPGAGVRRRRGDRLAALWRGGDEHGSAGSDEEGHGGIYARGRRDSRWA